MIHCPKTGAEVPTGLETDEASFATLPEVAAQMRCPSCGGVHRWTRCEAWLADGPKSTHLRLVTSDFEGRNLP